MKGMCAPTARAACRVILLVLSIMVASPAGAQPPTENSGIDIGAQEHGYWVDSSTELMWAAKDNGRDTTWSGAMRYCRNLRLAGYRDWRLPRIDELEGIVDKDAYSTAVGGVTRYRPNTDLRIRGGLALTGQTHWSSSQVTDVNGKPTGSAWYFRFAGKQRWNDDNYADIHGRALCVRGSIAPTPPSAQGTQERGYWVDPSTGLRWAAKDNGRNVTWRGAMRYCQKLRFAGYSDWRLATIDELESLIDKDAYGRKTVGGVTSFTFNAGLRVSGDLLLTGQTQWSSSQVPYSNGKPSGYAWYFDFVNVFRSKQDASFAGDHGHALCVRNSKTAPPHPSNGAKE